MIVQSEMVSKVVAYLLSYSIYLCLMLVFMSQKLGSCIRNTLLLSKMFSYLLALKRLLYECGKRDNCLICSFKKFTQVCIKLRLSSSGPDYLNYPTIKL